MKNNREGGDLIQVVRFSDVEVLFWKRKKAGRFPVRLVQIFVFLAKQELHHSAHAAVVVAVARVGWLRLGNVSDKTFGGQEES